MRPGPIVCGIDSSPGAGGGARVAGPLARELQLPLVLAQVTSESWTFPKGDDRLRERGRRHEGAVARLEEIAATIADVEPGVAVSFGEPAQSLASVCRERDAELLVVAPRLRRGLERLGASVSARLATRAPCPLVLVPRRTPWVAITSTTAIAMVLIASGDLSDLADTTVLLLLLVFTTVNVAVLVLRRDSVPHDHFRSPTAIPGIGAGVLVALMTTKDADVFGRVGGLLLVGMALWALNWWLHGRHIDPYSTGELEVVERRDLGRG